MEQPEAGPPEPPPPVEFDRRVALRTEHVLGMIGLVLIVGLAVGGFFDAKLTEVRVNVGGREVRLTYPGQLRFHSVGTFEIVVTGQASDTDSIQVTISPGYADRFEYISVPAGRVVSHDGVETDARSLRLDARAARPGRARGIFRVAVGEAHADIPIHTFIFP